MSVPIPETQSAHSRSLESAVFRDTELILGSKLIRITSVPIPETQSAHSRSWESAVFPDTELILGSTVRGEAHVSSDP